MRQDKTVSTSRHPTHLLPLVTLSHPSRPYKKVFIGSIIYLSFKTLEQRLSLDLISRSANTLYRIVT